MDPTTEEGVDQRRVAVRRELRRAAGSGAPSATLGQAFDKLPVGLRRPIDLMLAIQLVGGRTDSLDTQGTETVVVVREDGTVGQMSVLLCVLTQAEWAAI